MAELPQQIEQLAESLAQAMWPRLAQKLDAQNEQLRQLNELTSDLATRVALFAPLVAELQRQVDDCRAELDAMHASHDRSRHDQVEAFSTMRTWRDLADRRKRRIEELEALVERLKVQIREMERESRERRRKAKSDPGHGHAPD